MGRTIHSMAQPARPISDLHDAPPADPAPDVDRAYHLHRARRRARIEHRRQRRRARLRFWIFLLVLLAGAITLAVVIWREVQNLFGF
jgi:hypothetical protein